jgi:hypothetical protein
MQYTHPNSNFNGQLDLGLPDFQTNLNVGLVLGRRQTAASESRPCQILSSGMGWGGMLTLIYIYTYILDATLQDLLWHLHTHLTKEKAQWPK